MMKGGMAGLMKQAQQMQEKMAKMQEELANAEVTGQSGAGLVSVVMTGRRRGCRFRNHRHVCTAALEASRQRRPVPEPSLDTLREGGGE